MSALPFFPDPLVPLDLFLDNLLSPPILFFLLGIVATLVRSDLEIPAPIARLFSLYLLWAIGFKGGVELRSAGLDATALVPVAVAVGLSAVMPLVVFPLLRRRFGLDDACALAATYGSVSVVTFITAVDFLEARAIEHGGHMVAALALMESPAIVVGLMLRRMARRDATPSVSLGGILREALTSGPVFLLLGSLVAGVLVGPARFEPLRPFSYDIFHGVLVLFLLESGMVAGARLRELRAVGASAIAFGIVLPLGQAVIAGALARLLGMGVGDALLFVILSASASYIAVPAVMRVALPGANAGLYLPMSLGVTFPFNVCIGIPLYLAAIEWLWR